MNTQITPQHQLEATWDLMLSDAPKAIELLSLLLRTHRHDMTIQAECYFQLGWAHAYKGDNDVALKYFPQAIERFEQLKNQEKKVRALNGLASAYVELSLYQSALTVYNQALALASELKQPMLTIPIHINVAAVHCEINSFTIAKERLNTLESIFNKHKLESVIANDNLAIFHNLSAMVAWDDSNHELFTYHLDCSEKIAVSGNCLGALFVSKLLRIRLIASNSQYDLAVDAYLKLLEQYTLEDVGIEYFRALAELGNLLSDGQEYQKIIQVLEPEVLSLNSRSYSLSTIRAKELLASSYAKNQDFKQAYRELEQLSSAKEWSENEEAQQQSTLLNQSSQITQLERKAENEKQLRHEMEVMNKRQQIVSRISRSLSSSLELNTIINTLFTSLKQIAKVTNIAFGYHDDKKNQLSFEHGVDMGKALTPFVVPLDRAKSTSVRTFHTQSVTVLNEHQLSQVSFIGEGEPIQSAIFLPISHNGKKLGVLTIQSVHKRVFDAFVTDILQQSTSSLFSALNNSLAHQELLKLNQSLQHEKVQINRAKGEIEYLSNHDALTQLPNRTYMQKRLAKQIAVSNDQNRFSLIYFNLSQFKTFNSQYGFSVGDQLLLKFANTIKDNLNVGDFLARIGNDEFVAISRHEAWQLDANDTRQFMHEQLNKPIVVEGTPYKIHARIGIARYPHDGTSFDELMNVADHGN